MSKNKYNVGGDYYDIKEKPSRIKRKTMFDKNYVTLELILFCLGCAGSFAGLLYVLMNWL
tara:strand:- start:499 stop:678 length:180 start_codon:yes stop_codon:yes gene_type:complete